MLQNVFQLKADLKKKSTFVATPEIVQNDNVRFEIEVTDNGKPLALDNVQTVSLAHSTKGETVVTSGEIEGNKVIFNLGTLETKYVGQVNATVQLYDAEGRISTIKFPYYVVADPTGNYVPSEKEQTLIEVVMSEAQAKIDELSQVDVVDLKAKQDEFTAQLAQTTEKTWDITDKMNREVVGQKQRKPLMTFIDDDGRDFFLTKWKPIIEEKNVPVTVCLITNNVGNSGYMNWEQIEGLRQQGVEFVSHTHTHPTLTQISEQEMRYEFATSNRILKERGLQPNILVYPGGAKNAEVRRVARDYYRAAVDIDMKNDNINLPPIHTYQLKRVSLGGETDNTLAHYKSKIDEAVANNGWLIWMSHSQYPSFNEAQQQHIRDIIDYARSKGVEIINMNDGLDVYGNVMDIGDFSDVNGEFTIIDNEGILHSKTNEKNYLMITNQDGAIGLNTPMTEFEANKITRAGIFYDNKTGFPENDYGILETHVGLLYNYAFQFYYTQSSNAIYKRTWEHGNSKWGGFKKITITPEELDAATQTIITHLNAYSSSDPITAFPMNKVTICPVNGANASEVPNGRSGVIKTYRITSSTYSWQEYKPYGRNEIWMRYPSGDEAWTDFVEK